MARTKSTKAVVPNPAARLLSIKETAVYLGCTVWFARTLAWSHALPFIKMGKRIVFDRADLDAYVEKSKQAVA